MSGEAKTRCSGEPNTTERKEETAFDAKKAMDELHLRESERQKQQADHQADIRYMETVMNKLSSPATPTEDAQKRKEIEEENQAESRRIAEKRIEERMNAIADSIERRQSRSPTPASSRHRRFASTSKAVDLERKTRTPSPACVPTVVNGRRRAATLVTFDAKKALLELRVRQQESQTQQADHKAGIRYVETMMNTVSASSSNDSKGSSDGTEIKEKIAKQQIEQSMNAVADSLQRHHARASSDGSRKLSMKQ